ncbi:MAG: GTPase [Promethearchaeota archaeon]
MSEKSKKIVLIGRPEVGKTSIKQVIFEGTLPRDLIETPLKPTRGLSTSQYNWLDLNCIIFDTAGQNYQDIFIQENKQLRIFSGSIIIIYLFDYIAWVTEEDKQIILKDISTIQEILVKGNYKAELVLFLHKLDLVKEEERKKFIAEVSNEIKDRFGIRIFFTSILPKLIYNLYSTIYNILSSFSEIRSVIKDVLDEQIKELSNSMFFITNENNNIIAQSMTPDFEITYINTIYYLIGQLNETLENMKETDQINHLILQTRKELNIIMNFLDLEEFHIKNLILISETLTSNKLIWKAGEISRLLNKKIKYRR